MRDLIFEMAHRTQSCHVGSALSCVEILWAIYEYKSKEDVFIMSKGHAAMAFYATLAVKGIYALEQVRSEFLQNGKNFLGHLSHRHLAEVELSTGSLGHGMNYALGVAYKKQHQQLPGQVLVLLSDGECNSGAVWEAALFAAHHRLSNLAILIDYNRLQGLGRGADILSLENLAAKWQAFNFEVWEVDGHQVAAVKNFLLRNAGKADHQCFLPAVAICHTTKGKGWPGYEDTVDSHYHPYAGKTAL